MPEAATTPENTILLGDCIASVNDLAEGSVDLVFADPPYNIGFGYDGHYVDDKTDEQYLAWTYDWIDASRAALCASGSMYILIGDEYAAETRIHLKKLDERASCSSATGSSGTTPSASAAR